MFLFLDMCNHVDAPDVPTVHGLSPEGDFVVYAKKAIPQGDEIFLTYGPLPNRLLLAQFGFMLPALPSAPLFSDTALVRIDSLFQDNTIEVSSEPVSFKAKVEQELASQKEWEAGPGPIAVRQMKKDIFEKFVRNKDTGAVTKWQPAALARAVVEHMVEIENKKADNRDVATTVEQRYRALIQRELDSYSTTLAEDEDELRAGPENPRRRLALEFRIQAKLLLQREMGE